MEGGQGSFQLGMSIKQGWKIFTEYGEGWRGEETQ